MFTADLNITHTVTKILVLWEGKSKFYFDNPSSSIFINNIFKTQDFLTKTANHKQSKRVFIFYAETSQFIQVFQNLLLFSIKDTFKIFSPS